MDNVRFLTQVDLDKIQHGDINSALNLIDHNLDHPFNHKTSDDRQNPHKFFLRLIRNPDYLAFTCEYVMNVRIFPFQEVILRELWNRPFPMLVATRGGGKTFILALYAMLRALISQGSKIVIVGSAFRQSKFLFEYCEKIWANAPVLRDLCGSGKGVANRNHGPRRDIDRCELIIGDSIITALPLGDGRKIRGQRASHIIVDEFSSISLPIFETVIRGFGSVSQDPVENVEQELRVEILKRVGLWDDKQQALFEATRQGNQCVVAGSADYSFLPFGQYWTRYKKIIESKGDSKAIAYLHGGEENVDKSFNWKDYSIIRIPYDMIPAGFMDSKQIASSRSIMHSSSFAMEYGATFISDSEGFYRRSLLEKCVAGKPENDIPWMFHAQLKGTKGVQHIIGIDPASEQDNFAIVILALHGNHKRIVYTWTTNKANHKDKLRHNMVKEQDFYGYVARKIRDLMALFPTIKIMCDSQGGGVAIREALGDNDKLMPGEKPIIDIEDEDGRPGMRILEMVNFADAAWTGEANHGMRKDFEDRALLFPFFDPVALELAATEDKVLGRIIVENGKERKIHETLEDIVMEIEELKKELTTIVHTKTTTGRDKWDTPETKAEGSRKGRLRKDRYSALLMANMGGRTIQRSPAEEEYRPCGGFATHIDQAKVNKHGPGYYGKGSNKINDKGGYTPGFVVRR